MVHIIFLHDSSHCILKPRLLRVTIYIEMGLRIVIISTEGATMNWESMKVKPE